MRGITIYHNPRCRKSRETLALLEAAGKAPTIIHYLKTPPDEATLRTLAARLGMRPKEFIRKGEAEFKSLGLKEKLEDDKALYTAMTQHPKLIERPIVVSGEKAILGRPPENVKKLLLE